MSVICFGKKFAAMAVSGILALVCSAASVRADIGSDYEATEEYLNRSQWFELDPSADDSYHGAACKKISRGVLNAVFSPVEPFKGAAQASQERGLWTGILWGGFDGSGRGLIRALGGTYEFITFLAPLPEDKAAVDADTLDMTHVFGWTLE